MDELSPYTEAVSELARLQGRAHVGGIRFKVRYAGQRIDAELLTFAGDSAEEERALVVRSGGPPVLWVNAREDLAAHFSELGESPVAP